MDSTFAGFSIITITPIVTFIAGSIWTWYMFYQSREGAALSVKIDTPKANDKKDRLAAEVIISNLGKRDVDLLFKTARLCAMRLAFQPDDVVKTLEGEAKGLLSEKPRTLGRLRAGVSVRLPYWVHINGQGVYLIEFEIEVNMKRYHIWTRGKEKRFIKWSDRTIIQV
jgi:hypothetical protein